MLNIFLTEKGKMTQQKCLSTEGCRGMLLTMLVSNGEVVRKMEAKMKIILKIRRQLKFLENIMKKECFQSLTLTSHTEGKREAWEVADLARFCE